MRKAEKISALIIAAGFSSRMGEFKPLLPLGQGKVIEQSIRTFSAAGIDDIRVIVGHRADEVIPIITPLGAIPVLNEHYAEGMYSSVVAGVHSLPPDAECFFLLPGDVPTVKSQTVKEIVRAYREGDADIIYPSFRGRRGHPPLIATCFTPEILAWNGPGGLMAYLAEKEKMANDLMVTDQGVLMDMDFSDDYRKVVSYYNRPDMPTEEECYAILSRFGAGDDLVKHSQTVARVACRMAFLLNEAGCRLSLVLIKTAALLHDLAKGELNHAKAGAIALRRLGYPKVAQVVSVHTDIISESGGLVKEEELVYLADKMVRGDKVVPLEERFRYPLEKYSGEAEVLKKIKGRLDNAQLILKKINCILGENKEDRRWMQDSKLL